VLKRCRMHVGKKTAGPRAAALAALSTSIFLSIISLFAAHPAHAGQPLAPIVSLKGKGLPAGFTLADNATFSAFNTVFIPNSVVYADADSGSDTNPGTFSAPVKSLAAAQTLVRNSLAQTSNRNILVVLRGTFYLQQTFNLNASDSPANGHFVVWASDPTRPATISGGQVLSLNWSLLSASKNLYSANIGSHAFRNLIVNNRKAQRARLSLGQSAPIPGTGTVIDCSGCGLAAITVPQPIEIMRDVQWIEDRCPATLNVDQTITVLSAACMSNIRRESSIWAADYPTVTYYLTAIENGLIATTQPGEWSIDTNQHLLYYIPLPGENLATSTVIAPQQTNLVLLQNASNLGFLNLRFAHSDWEYPSASDGLSIHQADMLTNSTTLIPAAFDCEGCQNVLIMDSEFSDLGTSALRIGPGSRNNLIFHNSIHDLSASGLQIGEVQAVTDPNNAPPNNVQACLRSYPPDPTETSYTYVEDNAIHDIGQEYHSSVGLLQIYAAYSSISHNEIHDTPYTAVSVGWGWTITPSSNSHDNLITANLIYNAAGIATDAGGIYTLSAQSGTTISTNYIHDMLPGQAGLNLNVFSNGVYLDNGSSCITVVNNCMANIPTNEVFQNGPNVGNMVSQATSCPSGTTTVAGVRTQASAAVKYVRISDILPIVSEFLMHE
jgi:hypothetical protein